MVLYDLTTVTVQIYYRKGDIRWHTPVVKDCITHRQWTYSRFSVRSLETGFHLFIGSLFPGSGRTREYLQTTQCRLDRKNFTKFTGCKVVINSCIYLKKTKTESCKGWWMLNNFLQVLTRVEWVDCWRKEDNDNLGDYFNWKIKEVSCSKTVHRRRFDNWKQIDTTGWVPFCRTKVLDQRERCSETDSDTLNSSLRC